jgi:hypothetical protein
MYGWGHGHIARHLTQLAPAHVASAVEGHHMVDLRANANPLAHFVVMVAGHMGQHRLAGVQTQGV